MMPFSLQAFADTRPYLYHLTSVENLLGIKSCRTLKSAATLVREKDQLDLTQRRVNPISLSSSVTSSWLQTQRPLHFGNILFEGGWQMKDLLTRINSLVFFWPGTSEGPIPHGRRHFRGNDWPTACVALRVRTQTLFDSLGGSEPLFCTYNSGSPRCSGGKKSPRGPNTFLSALRFDRAPSKVVEVVFDTNVALPSCTEIAVNQDGNFWVDSQFIPS
jgi:hypothetical protein